MVHIITSRVLDSDGNVRVECTCGDQQISHSQRQADERYGSHILRVIREDRAADKAVRKSTSVQGDECTCAAALMANSWHTPGCARMSA